MAKKNDTVSVLAFEKKLVLSDGYLYGTIWKEKERLATPLALQEKAIRGTISNRLKTAIQNDPLKLNGEVEKANLQRVDVCALAAEQDTLKLQFSLKILGGGLAHPSASIMPSLNRVTAPPFANISLNMGVQNSPNGTPPIWRPLVFCGETELEQIILKFKFEPRKLEPVLGRLGFLTRRNTARAILSIPMSVLKSSRLLSPMFLAVNRSI